MTGGRVADPTDAATPSPVVDEVGVQRMSASIEPLRMTGAEC